MKILTVILTILVLFSIGLSQQNLADIPTNKVAGVDSCYDWEFNRLVLYVQNIIDSLNALGGVDADTNQTKIADALGNRLPVNNPAVDADTAGAMLAQALGARVENSELSTVVPANETDAAHDNFSEIEGSVAAGQYAAGSIDEPDLNVTNSPTDNYLLSYNLAGTNFTWVAPSATAESSWLDITVTDTGRITNFRPETGDTFNFRGVGKFSGGLVVSSIDIDLLNFAGTTDGTLNPGTDSTIYYEVGVGWRRALWPTSGTGDFMASLFEDSVLSVMKHLAAGSSPTTGDTLPMVRDGTLYGIDIGDLPAGTGMQATALKESLATYGLSKTTDDDSTIFTLPSIFQAAIKGIGRLLGFNYIQVDSLVRTEPELLPLYTVGDTSCISTTDTLPAGYAPRGFTIDTLVIVTYGAAAPNHTLQFYHSDGTALFASAQTINTLGTTKLTTFDDATGLAGRCYATTPAVTSIPSKYKLCAYAIGRWDY